MATGSHMHNLTTLIKRLEAATSRLEDMAMPLDDPTSPEHMDSEAAPEPAAPAPPKPAPPPPPPPAAAQLPPQIEDFDALIKGDVGNFVEQGRKIGGVVEDQSKAVLQAFQAERTYLYVSTKAKKPEPQPPELMTELHNASDTIDTIRESNRASQQFNHLSAVAEGIVALGWFFETKPADFVNEIVGGIQYYGNKVLKDYKDKDQTHVQYIQSYYQIFKSLSAYLKKHYPKGLAWNDENGIDAKDALKEVKGGAGAGAPTAGGPPPPPPPPPVPALNVPEGAPPPPPPPPGMPPAPAAAPGADMSAVFEQLNQGDSVTSGLRKVDKSEMTHKNPDLRTSSTVPDRQGSISRSKSPAPSKKPKPESMRSRKPPRRELEGNKWLVENYDNPGEILEIPAQQNQSILISKCNKTIVKVSSKANAISIDNCSGLSLIVDSLVSSLDVIKSPKFALQVDGVVPTVLLDQVDGATVYLGLNSLGTEVFTSKCSAVNIMLPPKEGSDEDTKECPVPEQIISYVQNGVLVNEIVSHVG